MFSEISNIEIIGMAAAVSNKWDSVRDNMGESETVIAKFIKNTGVEGRYSASPKQCASDFCFAAAEKILSEKEIDREKIGILVFVTQSPDYQKPATACVLQSRLGLSRDCIAFDVNLGCSGYIFGMNIISSMLAFTDTQYALLLAGDTSAREKSQNFKRRIGHSGELLFGDSGTATLIKKSPSDPIRISSNTDGSQFRAIIDPYEQFRNPDIPDSAVPGTSMDEIAVFNFATSDAIDQINGYMQKECKTPADYDCLVLHQANLMILKRIGKKTGFPPEKVLISLKKFANTSSSSIPISLVDMYGDRDENKEIRALCSGFGVGLSWATMALPINIKNIFPLIHTDDYFVDGFVPETND